MYLVTGATGNVGRHVVKQLLAAGADVRATSRQPSSARLPDRVEVIRTDQGSFPLDGVSAVFVNATAVGDRLEALLSQAKPHGVHRIVLLSSSAVLDEANPVGVHHRELERQVKQSGLEWTVLRPGVFNSNALVWSGGIRVEGLVRAPFATARIAPIDERDIAAVAGRALRSDGADGLLGAAPVLSGPEVLTPLDQVRIIGQAIGVSLRYEEETPEAVRRAILEAGEPPWVADGLLRYYARAAIHPVETSPAVAEITGEQPRTFASWAADHVTAFRAPARTNGLAVPAERPVSQHEEGTVHGGEQAVQTDKREAQR